MDGDTVLGGLKSVMICMPCRVHWGSEEWRCSLILCLHVAWEIPLLAELKASSGFEQEAKRFVQPGFLIRQSFYVVLCWHFCPHAC